MKLLIVNNNMHVGGIQNALINLLNEIADKYDVTLCTLAPVGELMADIPSGIKVISGNKFTKILGMSQAEAKADGVFTWLWRSLFAVVSKTVGTKVSYGILSHMQKLDGRYDAAISFMQNADFRVFYGGVNEFVLNAVEADLKLSFVHCAFVNYDGANQYNGKTYAKFDRIAGVSASQAVRVAKCCPWVSPEKVYPVHNCYDIEGVKRKAEEYEAEVRPGVVNILTPARICWEKGILRMLPIFARLKADGFKFVWKVAGSGPLFKEALEMRDKCGLQDVVDFMGLLPNPYPYFKSCDLLLLPSFYEAAPMIYGEAEILGIPVLTTDTTSAKELVADRGIGYVCGLEDDEVEKALRDILKDGIKPPRLGKSAINNELALKEFDNILRKD